MEITINTDLKTITLNEDANISELIDYLKKCLGDEYKDYKLEAIEPVRYVPYKQPPWPFDDTYTTCMMPLSNSSAKQYDLLCKMKGKESD